MGGFLFSLSLLTTDNTGCSKYGLVEQIHTRPGTKRDHPCDRYVSRAVAVIATAIQIVPFVHDYERILMRARVCVCVCMEGESGALDTQHRRSRHKKKARRRVHVVFHRPGTNGCAHDVAADH